MEAMTKDSNSSKDSAQTSEDEGDLHACEAGVMDKLLVLVLDNIKVAIEKLF